MGSTHLPSIFFKAKKMNKYFSKSVTKCNRYGNMMKTQREGANNVYKVILFNSI
jgi:hypothetical protein